MRSTKQQDLTTACAGWPRAALELGLGLSGVALIGGGLSAAVGLPVAVLLGAVAVQGALCALLWRHWPDPGRSLGPANLVTLGRAALVSLLAGAVLVPSWAQQHAWLLAGMAGAALLLDGVDGWAARRWRCEGVFGARFDMEVDAFLMLVLCVHLLSMGKAGPWVLAIGLMRYGFVLAMLRWPWLDAPLPASRRRKLVCVWQVASLLLCMLPVVGPPLAAWLLGLALGLLAGSFAIDVRWLYRSAASARVARP